MKCYLKTTKSIWNLKTDMNDSFETNKVLITLRHLSQIFMCTDFRHDRVGLTSGLNSAVFVSGWITDCHISCFVTEVLNALPDLSWVCHTDLTCRRALRFKQIIYGAEQPNKALWHYSIGVTRCWWECWQSLFILY